MAHHQCIALESPAEWDKALEGINHSFAHTWAHSYAMYLTTGLNTYLFSFESENVRIVCPVAEREFNGFIDIIKPYGFSGFVGNGESPEFRDYWMGFAQQKGYVCGYLGLSPICNYSSHFDQKEVSQYDTVHVLDLTLEMDVLFANLSTNRKRELKDWDRIRADLVLDRPTLERFFLENYIDFLRRKNAADFYFFSMESLRFLLSQKNVILIGAQEAGRIVAVNLFAFANKVGDYLLNASLPEGQHHSTALIWYGANYLKSKKIERLSLGGGNKGLADYKKKFGGKELPLQCLKQIYDPQTYQMLCRQVGADPHDMTGYFPGYRISIRGENR